jgi:hypothetical protein
MTNQRCTHTSDWHKEMIPCSACGAEYSDEEAEQIGNESTRTFSANQLDFIRKKEAEAEL